MKSAIERQGDFVGKFLFFIIGQAGVLGGFRVLFYLVKFYSFQAVSFILSSFTFSRFIEKLGRSIVFILEYGRGFLLLRWRSIVFELRYDIYGFEWVVGRGRSFVSENKMFIIRFFIYIYFIFWNWILGFCEVFRSVLVQFYGLDRCLEVRMVVWLQGGNLFFIWLGILVLKVFVLGFCYKYQGFLLEFWFFFFWVYTGLYVVIFLRLDGVNERGVEVISILQVKFRELIRYLLYFFLIRDGYQLLAMVSGWGVLFIRVFK